MTALVDSPLVLGQHSFTSRLFLGTGKYPSMDSMVESLAISGTQCVTVAVRRMQLGAPQGKTLLDYLPRDKYVLLPNPAGCFDADHAVPEFGKAGSRDEADVAGPHHAHGVPRGGGPGVPGGTGGAGGAKAGDAR